VSDLAVWLQEKKRHGRMHRVKSTKSIAKMRNANEFTAAISVDIKGAFDHLLWRHILGTLDKYQVPLYLRKLYSSYFRKRIVVYGDATCRITRGCPQGSIVGPMLWNIGYNVVLTWLRERWLTLLLCG